jgi:DNA (cytosine-5)-methyltransferase 1
VTDKPILIDWFACEGGATRGYQDAGFEVYAFDMLPKFAKRNPAEAFGTGDAVAALDDLLDGKGVSFVRRSDGKKDTLYLDDADAEHGSPPCQAYSITKHGHNRQHPMLIEPVRERFQAAGIPWVIENVVGAPLEDPLLLCWSMFNEAGSVIDDDGTPLRMERHRLFESNLDLIAPRPDHHDKAIQVAGAYGGARRDKHEARHVRHGGYVPSKEKQQELLGIDWMTQYGLYQSLPPVYTEWIGRQIKEAL